MDISGVLLPGLPGCGTGGVFPSLVVLGRRRSFVLFRFWSSRFPLLQAEAEFHKRNRLGRDRSLVNLVGARHRSIWCSPSYG